jgi:hypothetical protein
LQQRRFITSSRIVSPVTGRAAFEFRTRPLSNIEKTHPDTSEEVDKETRVPTELELDHLFWNAISTSQVFCSWILTKTKFASLSLSLVMDEKWHPRWYRDPVTGKDSETDILLMFSQSGTGSRYAIHLENKPDHRAWEPLQAENYRKRALDRMVKWRYLDFQTGLMALAAFIARSPVEVGHFDFAIPYEDLAEFVPAFDGDRGTVGKRY